MYTTHTIRTRHRHTSGRVSTVVSYFDNYLNYLFSVYLVNGQD